MGLLCKTERCMAKLSRSEIDLHFTKYKQDETYI